MNLNEFYKIINVTHHNGQSRVDCGRSSVMYRKYIGLKGKIIALERGKSFVMDEIIFSGGDIIRGFIVQTSKVLDFAFSEDKQALLVATQNSIYYLVQV